MLGCLPGLLLIAHYLHVIGEPLWYVEWRSAQFTEVLSALCAPLFGFLSVRHAFLFPGGQGMLRVPIIALGALLMLAPFLKPILLPVALTAQWANSWQDGVCQQSTSSTCGPAALATLLAQYGCKRSEREIARASYSSATGTELWYLMRYARRQGFRVTYMHEMDVLRVPVPAVLGTRVSVYGHYIVLLDVSHGRVTVGDPSHGRATMPITRFRQSYQFGGCVLVIKPE